MACIQDPAASEALRRAEEARQLAEAAARQLAQQQAATSTSTNG